jgi:hypothetical protein
VELARPLDAFVGNIQVQTMAFPLDGDLEVAGAAFLTGLQAFDASLN